MYTTTIKTYIKVFFLYVTFKIVTVDLYKSLIMSLEQKEFPFTDELYKLSTMLMDCHQEFHGYFLQNRSKHEQQKQLYIHSHAMELLILKKLKEFKKKSINNELLLKSIDFENMKFREIMGRINDIFKKSKQFTKCYKIYITLLAIRQTDNILGKLVATVFVEQKDFHKYCHELNINHNMDKLEKRFAKSEHVEQGEDLMDFPLDYYRNIKCKALAESDFIHMEKAMNRCFWVKSNHVLKINYT